MNYDALKFWFDVLQFVATAAVGIYVYITNRQRVTNGRISELEQDVDERLDDHHQRLTRVEERIGHMPTHNDIKELSRRIEEVHADLKEVVGKLGGINRAVDLINQHLLNGGK